MRNLFAQSSPDKQDETVEIDDKSDSKATQKQQLIESESPTRHRIADSIHTLMTKLSLVRGGNASGELSEGENVISPLNIDIYCNSNTGKSI